MISFNRIHNTTCINIFDHNAHQKKKSLFNVRIDNTYEHKKAAFPWMTNISVQSDILQ